MSTITIDTVREQRTVAREVPLSRVVSVELRKMFDTRSGFWLLASIGITGLLTMVGTIAFAPDKDLTYYTFARAIGFPMTFVLPIIAVLAITGEWSQRTGLTTFTLVPQRSRVVWAKVTASVVVGVAAMLFAFVTGAVGNLVGTAIAGVTPVWDVSAARTTVPAACRSSALEPCETIRPLPIITISSATTSISRSRCEESRTVPPWSA